MSGMESVCVESEQDEKQEGEIACGLMPATTSQIFMTVISLLVYYFSFNLATIVVQTGYMTYMTPVLHI